MEFVLSEIQFGLTMAKLAREAAYDEKSERNRARARKAYDAVIRFIPRLVTTSEEVGNLRRGLAQLESELRRLGEEI